MNVEKPIICVELVYSAIVEYVSILFQVQHKVTYTAQKKTLLLLQYETHNPFYKMSTSFHLE